MHPDFPTIFITAIDKDEQIHQFEMAEEDIHAGMEQVIKDHKPVMTIITKYSINHDSVKIKFARFLEGYKKATQVEASMSHHVGGVQ